MIVEIDVLARRVVFESPKHHVSNPDEVARVEAQCHMR